MTKILMSACLLGHKVRYDGGDCLQNHLRLQAWFEKDMIVTICPEMAGGLPTPRPPAEIQGNRLVMTKLGQDVTAAFIAGAQKTLVLVKKHAIRVAILKAKSPSCGSNRVYDGTFTKTLVPGDGVTAALLKQEGLFVFDENHIDEALDLAESFSTIDASEP